MFDGEKTNKRQAGFPEYLDDMTYLETYLIWHFTCFCNRKKMIKSWRINRGSTNEEDKAFHLVLQLLLHDFVRFWRREQSAAILTINCVCVRAVRCALRNLITFVTYCDRTSWIRILHHRQMWNRTKSKLYGTWKIINIIFTFPHPFYWGSFMS